MERGKISGTQLTFLMVWTMVATALVFLPVAIGRHVVQDAWLVPAVFLTIEGLFMVLIFSKLGLKYPEQTVIQYSQTILGKIGGKFLGFVFILWFVLTNAIIIREFGEFIVTTLPETPLIVVSGIMILITSITLKCGLEVLGRASEFFFPITFLSLTLAITLVTPQADLKRLLPVLDNGVLPVIRASMTPWSFMGELVTMLMLVPYLNRPQVAKRSAVLAVLLICMIGVLNESMITAVFGDLRTGLLFPYLRLVRMISIANFLERLDAIFIAVTIMGIFLKIAVFQYCSVLSIAQWLNLRSYQPLILPVGVISVALSILVFDNIPELIDFMDKTFPLYALPIEVGIPIILLIASYFRPNGKNKKEQ